ncbi:hypothetical protein NJBCHELONAE_48930 [Mycobacteroides chelonae]|uniref:hypothetical protein n=1 Tax=Mycobacteroides chelonae TaxID=1774 RepID=UPI0021DD420B|nr:hypothetical protein [Mycobacteroides chelonae]GLE59580.1 hypothetical protein NJBCHELONAE_48930 [Mycobacteroides chelonae]
MNLQELAADRGFTIDSSPDELCRIATEVVHREFYPESVYDTLRSLMRMQRQMRANQQWAALDPTAVPA